MKSKIPQYYQSTPLTEQRARELRKQQTAAEKRLWEMLRNRQVNNAKFRRQHPVGPFIADFYCHEHKLIIELDGSIHDLPEVKQRDILRQQHIENPGLTVLRFCNADVFEIPEQVIEKIKMHMPGQVPTSQRI